jgi:hypothetical protein
MSTMRSSNDRSLEQVEEAREAQIAAGYVIEARGINFLRELTPEEWAKVGQEVATTYKSIEWAIGDWLIYGEGLKIKMGRPTKIDATSSIYERAMAITGLTHASLYTFARAARDWAFETRVPFYSVHLHEYALKLPDSTDRIRILNQAAEKKLSTTELAEEIDRNKLEPGRWPEVKKPASTKSKKLKSFPCPHCGEPITKAQALAALKATK